VCWAASHGEAVALKMLLQRGCSPSSKEDGVPATILAAEAENWDIVKLLVNSRADVLAGYTSDLPEHHAMKSNPQTVDIGARGLLQLAAIRNNTEMLALLLDMGTNIDILVKPLKRQRYTGNYDPITQRREQFSWTALHLATKTGSLEAIKLLLARGARVNQTTLRGDTALHIAVLYAVAQPRQMITEKDPKIHNKSLQVIRLLLENGANMNASSSFVSTPLHLAISSDRNDLCRLLLESGPGRSRPDANTPDTRGNTPLQRIVEGENVQLAKWVLNAGGNVNVKKPENGRMPLHTATLTGNTDMAKVLLEHGAEVNGKETNGTTPLQIAATHRLYEIAKLLIDRGADITPFLQTGDYELRKMFPRAH
jgi:ankyrin repeat protein